MTSPRPGLFPPIRGRTRHRSERPTPPTVPAQRSSEPEPRPDVVVGQVRSGRRRTVLETVLLALLALAVVAVVILGMWLFRTEPQVVDAPAALRLLAGSTGGG